MMARDMGWFGPFPYYAHVCMMKASSDLFVAP